MNKCSGLLNIISRCMYFLELLHNLLSIDQSAHKNSDMERFEILCIRSQRASNPFIIQAKQKWVRPSNIYNIYIYIHIIYFYLLYGLSNNHIEFIYFTILFLLCRTYIIYENMYFFFFYFHTHIYIFWYFIKFSLLINFMYIENVDITFLDIWLVYRSIMEKKKRTYK